MKLNLYQVDAFTSTLFKGNPAAVVPLEKWIDDELMQKLAMENNLAETVFFVPSQMEGADYDIRWFTPELEINLCGHATLASAFVLYTQLGYNNPSVTFNSKSGLLTVEKNGTNYEMDFPSWKPERISDYPDGGRFHSADRVTGQVELRQLVARLEVAGADDAAQRRARPGTARLCPPDHPAARSRGRAARALGCRCGPGSTPTDARRFRGGWTRSVGR